MAQKYVINNDNIIYTIVEKETVILNLDNGYYYSLNEAGTKIWRDIIKQTNLGGILDSLKEEYNATARQLESDLIELLKDLEKEKLIKKQS